MEAVGLLPQETILQDWWAAEVKDNFWQQDTQRRVKELVKDLMESTMIHEIVKKTALWLLD